MIWTAFAGAVTCGSCLEQIPARAPVLQLTPFKRNRCAVCASLNAFEVDQMAVDRARLDLDAVAAANAAVAPVRVGRSSEPHLRHEPLRQPLPLSAIAGSVFDSKAAAAGDRDE